MTVAFDNGEDIAAELQWDRVNDKIGAVEKILADLGEHHDLGRVRAKLESAIEDLYAECDDAS